MKILHVTDFHHNKKWYNWLYSQKDKYDHICLTGDLVDVVHRDEKDRIKDQIKYVIEFLMKWDGCPLHICSGNHDVWVLVGNPKTMKNELYDTLYVKEFARYTMDFAMKLAEPGLPKNVHYHKNMEYDDFWICGLPWTGSDDAQYFTAPQVEDKIKKKIVLHHCPPLRLKTAQISSEDKWIDFFENSPLYDWCRHQQQNVLILSGHIHTPEKWYDLLHNVISLNPGRLYTMQTPFYIKIDLTNNRIDAPEWSNIKNLNNIYATFKPRDDPS